MNYQYYANPFFFLATLWLAALKGQFYLYLDDETSIILNYFCVACMMKVLTNEWWLLDKNAGLGYAAEIWTLTV